MKPELPGLSLRQKLALLISGLAAAVLVAAVALAYREVRQSAVMTAVERLDRVSHRLADLARASVEARRGLIAEVGRDPEVSAAMRLRRVDTATVARALDVLHTPADADLPIHLWTRDRRLVFSTGAFPPVDAVDTAGYAPLDSVPSYGPFRSFGAGAVYWTATPVERAGRIDGWIAQLRRIGSPASAGPIEALIGSDARVLFAHRGDSVWVNLAGELEPAHLEDVSLGVPLTFDGADGTRHMAQATLVEGTPWMSVVETPLTAVLARPRSFLQAMLTTGLVLVLAAMLTAWVVARRLTRPIQELAFAANAIAQGRYDRRVPVDRSDELGTLAGVFNAMAEQVSQSHEELRRRFEEARTMAAELESANVDAERARDDAQAANRAKSEFLATMSHEIRTPINAVIGYADLLELGIPGPVTKEQKGYLERIKRASQLLIALVNDVLDFAKLESGRMRVRPGIGSIDEAARGARTVLQPEAERKGVSLTVECAEGPPFLGDTQRVEQILVNLLSNAVKFTPRGGAVRLRCAAAEAAPPVVESDGGPAGWLRVDVEDTGVGIAAAQLPHIFDPFVQADSGYTRDHGGAGLGLSISRSLAAMMGGDITVESEKGRGSRFTLWLRAAGSEENLPIPETAA